MTDTVPCDHPVRCQITRYLEARCPVVDEQDRYEVAISWMPDGETFEKHAVADEIDSLSGSELSQESVAHHLFDRLSGAAVEDLRVTVQDVEHMDMEVVAE